MPSHFLFVNLVFLLSLSLQYLVYCISGWGSTYPSNLNRIFLLQKKVLRIISKSAFDAHTEPIFKQLKILNLSDIYRSQVGNFMFSFRKGLLRDAFSEIIILENYNSIYLFSCRTNIRVHQNKGDLYLQNTAEL